MPKPAGRGFVLRSNLRFYKPTTQLFLPFSSSHFHPTYPVDVYYQHMPLFLLLHQFHSQLLQYIGSVHRNHICWNSVTGNIVFHNARQLSKNFVCACVWGREEELISDCNTAAMFAPGHGMNVYK